MTGTNKIRKIEILLASVIHAPSSEDGWRAGLLLFEPEFHTVCWAVLDIVGVQLAADRTEPRAARSQRRLLLLEPGPKKGIKFIHFI